MSELGQSIMRLAGKIHDEVIGDVGEAITESLSAGYDAGYRAGSQSSFEAMKLCYRAGRDESTGEGR